MQVSPNPVFTNPLHCQGRGTDRQTCRCLIRGCVLENVLGCTRKKRIRKKGNTLQNGIIQHSFTILCALKTGCLSIFPAISCFRIMRPLITHTFTALIKWYYLQTNCSLKHCSATQGQEIQASVYNIITCSLLNEIHRIYRSTWPRTSSKNSGILKYITS